MRKISFDIVALIIGGMFFFVYWAMFEDSFLKFPNIVLTLYFFVCTICFSFVLETFEATRNKRMPSIFLRLMYLGLYSVSPFYLTYLLIRGRDKN